MSRINTNIGALIAQTHLQRSNAELQTSLQRLSSGLRINRGADDPAGLITSESLRAEKAGISQAITNSQRASNVIATAEGALNEVAALLVNIQELTIESANTGVISPEEIQANQLQVDSAIESITRISNTTSFAGLKLLDGSLAYVASGVNQTAIKDLNIYSVQFGTMPYLPVNISVTTSAQKGVLQYPTSVVTASCTIEVRGPVGVLTLPLKASASVSTIVQAINTTSDSTGVTASYINSANPESGIAFKSSSYGSSEFVQVTALSGTFAVENEAGATVTRNEGRDVIATINGISSKGDGLQLNFQSLGIDLDLTLTETFNKVGSTSFAITKGGAKFQLGPAVNTNQQANIGIRSVAASNLGNSVDGYLSDISTNGAYSLTKDVSRANRIVTQAIRQVSVLRGRLGAFEKNVLETNVNSLQITLENVTASESQIRDADFAAETSAMTRAQILNQAGTSVLKMANQTPQSVLSLLS
ncbi:MAG: flagellin [Phycisphaerae bacterium]|jgi:flagellin|nr:flagellin [Phycisphaerae bacterium]